MDDENFSQPPELQDIIDFTIKDEAEEEETENGMEMNYLELQTENNPEDSVPKSADVTSAVDPLHDSPDMFDPSTSSNLTLNRLVMRPVVTSMRVCRVCLQDRKRLQVLPIVSQVKGDITGITIMDMINAVSCIKAKVGDGLPNEVCTQCAKRIIAAYRLKSQCESANVILRTLLNKLNCEKEVLDEEEISTIKGAVNEHMINKNAAVTLLILVEKDKFQKQRLKSKEKYTEKLQKLLEKQNYVKDTSLSQNMLEQPNNENNEQAVNSAGTLQNAFEKPCNDNSVQTCKEICAGSLQNMLEEPNKETSTEDSAGIFKNVFEKPNNDNNEQTCKEIITGSLKNMLVEQNNDKNKETSTKDSAGIFKNVFEKPNNDNNEKTCKEIITGSLKNMLVEQSNGKNKETSTEHSAGIFKNAFEKSYIDNNEQTCKEIITGSLQNMLEEQNNDKNKETSIEYSAGIFKNAFEKSYIDNNEQTSTEIITRSLQNMLEEQNTKQTNKDISTGVFRNMSQECNQSNEQKNKDSSTDVLRNLLEEQKIKESSVFKNKNNEEEQINNDFYINKKRNVKDAKRISAGPNYRSATAFCRDCNISVVKSYVRTHMSNCKMKIRAKNIAAKQVRVLICHTCNCLLYCFDMETHSEVCNKPWPDENMETVNEPDDITVNQSNVLLDLGFSKDDLDTSDDEPLAVTLSKVPPSCTSSVPNVKIPKLNNSKRRIHACTNCDKVFELLGGLRNHKKLEHPEFPTKLCTICGKIVTKKNWSTHQNHHAGKKTYTCETCSKQFLVLAQLKGHMRTHTKETPFKCALCPAQYAARTSLKNHLDCHSNNRPHVCMVCEKGFTNRRNMELHQKAHAIIGDDSSTDSDKDYEIKRMKTEEKCKNMRHSQRLTVNKKCAC